MGDMCGAKSPRPIRRRGRVTQQTNDHRPPPIKPMMAFTTNCVGRLLEGALSVCWKRIPTTFVHIIPKVVLEASLRGTMARKESMGQLSAHVRRDPPSYAEPD